MTELDAYFSEGADLAVELANLPNKMRQGRAAAGLRLGPGVRVRGDAAIRVSAELRSILLAESPAEFVDRLNALLAARQAALTLVAEKESVWRLHLHPAEADPEALDAVKAAAGLAALIDAEQFTRIRRCAADRCDDWFLDRSRNGNRRYCTRGCANRVNASASRARRAEA